MTSPCPSIDDQRQCHGAQSAKQVTGPTLLESQRALQAAKSSSELEYAIGGRKDRIVRVLLDETLGILALDPGRHWGG